MADTANIWRELFQTWPAEIPQRGVLITNFNEQVQFVGFLFTDQMLMLERGAPDANGGRRLLIPFAHILAVKVTDPVKNEIFTQAGFLPGGQQKSPPKARVVPRATLPQG